MGTASANGLAAVARVSDEAAQDGGPGLALGTAFDPGRPGPGHNGLKKPTHAQNQSQPQARENPDNKSRVHLFEMPAISAPDFHGEISLKEKGGDRGPRPYGSFNLIWAYQNLSLIAVPNALPLALSMPVA